MNIEINVWKDTGKWYTLIETEVEDIVEIEIKLHNIGFKGMTATVYIIEEDGYKQPYRLYRL